MLCDEKERIDILGIKDHPWYVGKKMGEWANKDSQAITKDKSRDSGLGNETESVSQEMKDR